MKLRALVASLSLAFATLPAHAGEKPAATATDTAAVPAPTPPTPEEAAADPVKPVTDVATNSPKEALRKAIFGEADLGKPGCRTLKIDPRGGVSALDPELDSFLKSLISAVQKQKELDLQPLFHKRLNVAIPPITESFAKLDMLIGAPYEVSIYRLWAFNTVDGAPTGLPCAEDALTAYPLYGYPLQLGVWLQLLGKRELGRIYVALVPADGRWNIGAYHTHQWTHASKDFVAWAEAAQQDARKGLKEAAYVKFDLAQKLLDGGGFLEATAQTDIIKARDAQMSREDWEKAVRTALPGTEVLYTNTILVMDGAGIVVRVRVPGEISVVDIQKNCAKIAKTVESTRWGSSLTGVRCSFLMPKEDPKRDGAMGGVYVSFAELKGQKKG